MKKANVKPQVIWISRDKNAAGLYEYKLFSSEPFIEEERYWIDKGLIDLFRKDQFHRLYDIRLRPGQKKRLYGYFTFVEVKE